MALAGTLGYLVGAIVGWAIGLYGGRPLLERHGRWFHLDAEKLDRAERWFDRWEDWAVLLGRVTPVVRSFISIPAGVFRDAVRPLHGADADRLGSLVLRARRRRLGPRLELRDASTTTSASSTIARGVAAILALAAYLIVAPADGLLDFPAVRSDPPR